MSRANGISTGRPRQSIDPSAGRRHGQGGSDRPGGGKTDELRGTLGKPVQHIRFEGIAFRHGGWLRPSKIGHVDVQANFVSDPGRKNQDGTLSDLDGEYLKSPANVVCRMARSIRFERCTFAQLGGAGLDIEYGSQDNVVSGCRFYDISGTAVQVGGVERDDHHPDDLRKVVKNDTVVNCYIHDCCLEYMDGLGVFAGYTDGTRIARQRDLPFALLRHFRWLGLGQPGCRRPLQDPHPGPE